MSDFRIERDSMGEMEIPDDAVDGLLSIPKLSRLSLIDSVISDEALAKFQEGKPDLSIDQSNAR